MAVQLVLGRLAVLVDNRLVVDLRLRSYGLPGIDGGGRRHTAGTTSGAKVVFTL